MIVPSCCVSSMYVNMGLIKFIAVNARIMPLCVEYLRGEDLLPGR